MVSALNVRILVIAGIFFFCHPLASAQSGRDGQGDDRYNNNEGSENFDRDAYMRSQKEYQSERTVRMISGKQNCTWIEQKYNQWLRRRLR